jgi:hypothetical protein
MSDTTKEPESALRKEEEWQEEVDGALSAKEPFVISATRCGSTIIQRVGSYALHGRAGVLRKSHCDFSPAPLLGNVPVIIAVRNPMYVFLSMYRTSYLDAEAIPNRSISEEHYRDFMNYRTCLKCGKSGACCTRQESEILKNLDILSNLYNIAVSFNPKDVCLIKYEDIIGPELGDYTKLYTKLCSFFNKPFDSQILSEMHEELDYNKIKSETKSLKSFDNSGNGYQGLHIGEALGLDDDKDQDKFEWRIKFMKSCLPIIEKEIIHNKFHSSIMSHYYL